MKSRIFLLLVFLGISSVVSEAAQIMYERKYDPNKLVLHTLQNAARAKYGTEYKISFHIMDSLIANSVPDEITDPYGTLTGCILFQAWNKSQEKNDAKDSVVTGMFKNGQIIWDDYPGTKADFASALFVTKDINNDGEVDIIQLENDFILRTKQGEGISYLWILSWNGKRGKIINEIDPITRQSMIVVSDVCDLVDFNGDGIMEIRGTIENVWQEYFPNLKPHTLPFITYGWNDSKYGYYSSIHQIAGDEFYPANLLNVSVCCDVTIHNNSYTYKYTWTNKSSSKQGINDIYICGLEDTSSNFAPDGWEATTSRYLGGRAFFSTTGDPWDAIRPGVTLAGFATISSAIPTIAKYYVQGWRESTSGGVNDNERRSDILTNSVTGYTLGTTDTAKQVSAKIFLDTLLSYTRQSVTLGWLKSKRDDDREGDERSDDGIVRNIEKRIEKAKKELVKGDSVKARQELEKLVKKVEKLYKRTGESEKEKHGNETVISSEAYALLKYNAEYLIDRLPREKGRKKGEKEK